MKKDKDEKMEKSPEQIQEAAPAPKKRGRKPKSYYADLDAAAPDPENPYSPAALAAKKRGRKPKAAKEPVPAETDPLEAVSDEEFSLGDDGGEYEPTPEELEEEQEDLNGVDTDEEPVEEGCGFVEPPIKRRRRKDGAMAYLETPQAIKVPIYCDQGTMDTNPEIYFVPLAPEETYLISPYACGISCCPSGMSRHREHFPYFVMGLVLDGEGELIAMGHSFPLKPKDAFILHYNETHTIITTSVNRLKYIWITLRPGPVVHSLTPLGLDTASQLTLEKEEFDKVRSNFLKILDAVKTRDKDYRIDIAALCFRIFHHLSSQAQVMKSQHTNIIPAQVQTVMAYVEKNIDSHLSMDDLAKVAGCCRVHLTRMFVKYMGMRTMEWLIQLRLRKACYLLKHTDEQVNNLAKKVGFDDPFHFSTAFRKKVGVTPLRYRQMSRNGDVESIV